MKVNIKQQGFGTIALVIVVIIVSTAIGVGVYISRSKKTVINEPRHSINSFDECVAAGNPIMESYPEQCAANDKTFSNPNQKVKEIPSGN